MLQIYERPHNARRAYHQTLPAVKTGHPRFVVVLQVMRCKDSAKKLKERIENKKLDSPPTICSWLAYRTEFAQPFTLFTLFTLGCGRGKKGKLGYVEVRASKG